MEQTIEKVKQEARNLWSCETGEQRGYLRNKLEEYSTALGIPQEELLKSWEEDRSYIAINYYQEGNQPSIKIKADKVKVFDSLDDLTKVLDVHKFRCPSCSGNSIHPYECKSGKEMPPGKTYE